MSRLFVYGTLKSGDCRSHHLVGQTLIGIGKTQPRYRMFKVDSYPGLVEFDTEGESITGEIWEVDDDCLAHLDRVEGVPEGLYERRPIALLTPFDKLSVEAYFYLESTHGKPDCGSNWVVG